MEELKFKILTVDTNNNEAEQLIDIKYEKIFKSTFPDKEKIPLDLYEKWIDIVKKFESGEIKLNRYSIDKNLRKQIYLYLLEKPSNELMIKDINKLDKEQLDLSKDKIDEILKLTVGEFIDSVFYPEDNTDLFDTEEKIDEYLSKNFIMRNALYFLNVYLESNPRKEVLHLLKDLKKNGKVIGFFDVQVEV